MAQPVHGVAAAVLGEGPRHARARRLDVVGVHQVLGRRAEQGLGIREEVPEGGVGEGGAPRPSNSEISSGA